MEPAGVLIKEATTFAIEVTLPIVIGNQENLSRKLYTNFESAYDADEWFYRVYPFGNLTLKA